MIHRIVNWGAAEACEDSVEHSSSLEETAGKDGCMVPNYMSDGFSAQYFHHW